MLNCEGWEQLDENQFADSVYFKMSAIGRSKLLEKRFPVMRKKLGIYNGGGRSGIKECNYSEGFGILENSYGDWGCRDRLILEGRTGSGENTINSMSCILLIIKAGETSFTVKDLDNK